ncbi:fido domain-containing protein [Apiosordaria backusii]|uniref:Fido domain-containing protein n=1 Tax=Apiosordaria backusii TaxID=314023 RepID=A0AA40BLB7_9PEZI|nr:fido domain-containing protein [Apiosordaria backusii]
MSLHESMLGEHPLTISMGDDYDYNVLGDDDDPDDLYNEYLNLLAELDQCLGTMPLLEASAADEHRALLFPKLLFGSNFIEKAGGPLDITQKICRFIYYENKLLDTTYEQQPFYHGLEDYLSAQGRPSDRLSILRSYREIVQHAKALRYLMAEFDKRPIDEAMILQTHRILTEGIDTDQGCDWTEYSGVYRKDQVVAGLHAFPPAAQVPAAMRKMISSLHRDLQTTTKEGKIDPVALAAKYSHLLVNIHPFLDGNGRMSRILLNVLLYKLGAGALACFGQNEEEREEYLGIAARASQNMAAQQDEWDEGDEMAPKYHKELASYTLKHVVYGLREWKQALEESKKASIPDYRA